MPPYHPRRISANLLLAFLAALFTPGLLSAQNPPPAQPASLGGTWQGTLVAGPAHLRVVLAFTPQPDGLYAARLYSIDQGPDAIRANTVTIDGQHVHVVLSAIGGSYDGTLQPDGATLKGTWTQGGPPLPLDLARATETARWNLDTSPHRVSFVPVAPDVKLEVLDWGGTGRPLVLLAGLGNSAHVFDQFAPKLTPHFHVYGITRRGFGESSIPAPDLPANYTADRLGDDVLAVLAALHLQHPLLAGHSIAGEELSSVATRHPDAVSGLIYLDAGFGYALYDPARGDYIIDLLELRRKLDQLLPGSGVDNIGPLLEQVQASLPRFTTEVAEQQQQFAVMPHPPAGTPSTPPASPPPLAPPPPLVRGAEKYTHIPSPTLAIFAVPHDFKPMFPNDPKALAAAEAFDTPRMSAIADGFARAVPTAHVIRLKDADHYVFRSNEADVLREINVFAATLPQ